jgi:hypothetical protein
MQNLHEIMRYSAENCCEVNETACKTCRVTMQSAAESAAGYFREKT